METNQPLQRQEQILRLLARQGSITVAELIQEFGVSGWTVRRDLARLQARQAIVWRRGAIKLAGEAIATTTEPVAEHMSEKQRIARAAAALIAADQRLALGAGTTTGLVAHALRGRSALRVVTNGLNIALTLATEPGIKVTCTGGEVDDSYLTLVGPVAERALRHHFFDLAVVGVSGITAAEGLTVASPLNAACLELMIEHAAATMVVADHSKFGRVAFARLAALDVIDILVTDVPPPADIAEACRAAGVQCLVAG
ncbi:MAG TPA: DeoR/GlpR family DNA-binding transcription regulator [Roseiflexaceae bacterium]|nr:DeoR/GlpR family DNA-binding transcription regulator [Roseiflexaceae bacterium]HMP43155.1 DeoR/GlpR family DNA-binding transcription regulator [Roseiflexaceae bacterium]